MSSGQAWWSDHEDSIEHISGECSCTLAFRRQCGMPPPIYGATEKSVDICSRVILDRDGREAVQDWTSDWGRSPEAKAKLEAELSNGRVP